ncbi:SDR family oxidoreductase [Crenalkalicoccus roseus]|uniref:SDR family oxidoreductase n=1 Tax=Crenalkalicoccus roseus TaxID=1485588 RepID=UPI00107FEE13|nr:SDR family oxidoreductase [Crenalkalicoccus roseus]
MRSLRNAVVVIAGASSGIGRATALAFARRGARVVVAARRAEPLEAVARGCRTLGGEGLAVPTDVTNEAAVRRLAQAALDAHGRIDVWVNNVGTGVFGAFQDAPVALHRRVIEANLLGAMHGAAAALPVFLRQGGGVLINMVSMGGWAPVPFAASYAAGKFGLRGFTASLRAELADRPGIRVSAVFPALVDTPGFAHAANVSGRALEPPGPFLAPEKVAEVILRLALRPRDEVAVGWPSAAARLAYALAPRLTERAGGVAMRCFLRRARPAPRREGALLAPVPEGTAASGGWRGRRRGASPPALRLAGYALAGAGLLFGAERLLARRAGTGGRGWRRL